MKLMLGVILTGIVFVLEAVFETEIQAFWTATGRSALSRMGEAPMVRYILCFALGAVAVGGYAWLARSRFKAVITYLEEIREVDSALLPMLAGLHLQKHQPAVALENLMRQYLRQLADVVFPDDSAVREAIFVPTADRCRLVPLVAEPTSSGISGTKMDCRLDFADGRPRGECSSASAAFLLKELRVAHFDRNESGHWSCDDPHWYYSTADQQRPRYLAVASIPLLDSSGNCIGVVSLGSGTRELFDSKIVQRALADMASRAACALSVYQSAFPNDPVVAPHTNQSSLDDSSRPPRVAGPESE